MELVDSSYRPCCTLGSRQIPYESWFEDALRCYEVPTATFQLYLLVDRLDRATDILLQDGWIVNSVGPQIGNASVSSVQCRLSQLEQAKDISYVQSDIDDLPLMSQELVLLLAKDWQFDITTGSTTMNDISIPRLPALLDSSRGSCCTRSGPDLSV
jgi:hypothetical protein